MFKSKNKETQTAKQKKTRKKLPKQAWYMLRDL